MFYKHYIYFAPDTGADTTDTTDTGADTGADTTDTGADTTNAFDDADDLKEDGHTDSTTDITVTGYSQDDDGNFTWEARDADGNTGHIEMNDDGSWSFVADNPTTEEQTHEETHTVTADEITDDMLDDGYTSDDVEDVLEDGTIVYEDGHTSEAGKGTVTETVTEVVEVPTVVELPSNFFDKAPDEMKSQMMSAMSKSDNPKAQAQAREQLASILEKNGVNKASINQLINQGTGRGTSKEALADKQALSNYLNSGNTKAAAQLLGIPEEQLVQMWGKDPSGQVFQEMINDKYPNGPVDPAAQAMLGAMGYGTPNEAFNKAYAENLAKGMDPGRAYDAALDAAGIAPTSSMNQFIRDAAVEVGLFLLTAGGSQLFEGALRGMDMAKDISKVGKVTKIAGKLFDEAKVSARLGNSILHGVPGVMGKAGVKEAATIINFVANTVEATGNLLIAAEALGLTLGEVQDMYNAYKTYEGDAEKAAETLVGSDTSSTSTSIGSGSSSTNNTSGASTSNSIVSGTTNDNGDSRGSVSGSTSSNYNPFDVYTPDFSDLNGLNTISGEGMGSGKPVDSTSDNDDKPNQGINLNDSDSDNNSDYGGATVGNTGDAGKPKDNPNAGGSETTEGIKNDVNGNKVDFNVNTSRIGFSDDPNKANYDERDAKRWNRGMEDLSLNVVSDEQVKAFISSIEPKCTGFIKNTYRDDPLMQRWSKRVIEITKNPDGSITKTETMEKL